MATQRGLEFIAVSAEMRQVVRDLRKQLGVSRSTLEQRAKVGTDYLKHLEGGRHPSVEVTRLRRVIGVLQQAAAREKVPVQLNARLARVVKAVTPSSKATEKRSAPARKQSKRS
jgi:predicted transcriptional regulator